MQGKRFILVVAVLVVWFVFIASWNREMRKSGGRLGYVLTIDRTGGRDIDR